MEFRKSSDENLLSLGYTQDEARFLYLVAMHSGYFSARQYLTFAGAKSGEKSMAFSRAYSCQDVTHPKRPDERHSFAAPTCERRSHAPLESPPFVVFLLDVLI